MRKLVNHLIQLTFAATAGGCASVYVAPNPPKDSATISFNVTGSPALGYAASLWMMDKPDDSTCFAKKSRMAIIFEKSPIGTTNNPDSIPIASGIDIGVQAIFIPANVIGQIGCTQHVRFIPTAGTRYRINVDWLRNSCKTSLLAQSTDGAWIEVPTANTKILKC